MIRGGVVTFLFFAALHVAGCARYVSVLSGTLEGGRWGLFLGLLYALSWFAVVVIVPVLLIAGVAERVVARRFNASTPLPRPLPTGLPVRERGHTSA